jgi:two-component system, OmpR family, phosphate regulon response regulator OmpR
MSAQAAGHLLVVDDDDRIRTLLQRYLSAQGHTVLMAADAAQARKLVDIYEFDLIVLDIMMPGEDGLSLTRALRAERSTPILLLTARGEARDRIDGLSAGADDYLAKPFEPEELALRISSILKRTRPAAPMDVLQFGEAAWHMGRSELRRDGMLVRLTDAERRMMEVFAARPGDTFSREELARKLGVAADRSIDVQITRLRRKLEDDAGEPVYLKTMRGQGYRLMPDLQST